MSAHVRERLSAYLDDELAAEARAAVEAHVAQCPECASQLEALASVDSALAALPAREAGGADAAFAARVRAQIEAEGAGAQPRRHVRGGRWPAWTWAAAAALLVAAVTPLTLREWRASAPASSVAAPTAPLAAAPREAVIEAARRTPTVDARKAGDGSARDKSREDEKGLSAAPAVGTARGVEGASSSLQGLGDATPVSPQAASAPTRAQAPEEVDAGRALTLRPGPARSAPTAAAPATRGATKTDGSVAAFAPPPPRQEAQRAGASEASGGEGGVPGGVVGGTVGSVDSVAESRRRGSTPAPAPAAAPSAPGVAEGEARTRKESARADAAPATTGRNTSALAVDAFARLEAERPKSAEEWRRLRAEWRSLGLAQADRLRADRAFVQAIEAAAAAYRASTDASDRRILEQDVAEYLERGGVGDRERVRRLLREARP